MLNNGDYENLFPIEEAPKVTMRYKNGTTLIYLNII